MIITISGPPGAGTTTVSKLLAEKLGYKIITVGEIYKKLAEEKGIKREQIHKMWEIHAKNPAEEKRFHEELDRMQKEIAKKEKKAIFNGKLSAFQIPWADLKILLKASLEIRAKRIAGREGITEKKAAESVKEREMFERTEWKKIYGIDYVKDNEIYDVILNTDYWNAKEVAEIIHKIISLKKEVEK